MSSFDDTDPEWQSFLRNDEAEEEWAMRAREWQLPEGFEHPYWFDRRPSDEFWGCTE